MNAQRIRIGSRGQGSLVKNPDSRHWISVYYNADGKQVRESTGTPDEKKARATHKKNIEAVAAERQGHTPVLLPAQKRVTVTELLDALEADQELRGLKSAKKAAAHAKPIRAHFGTWRAVNVTAEAVDKYIATRKAAGKKNATVNRSLQTLIAAFGLAVRRRTLTRAPSIRKLSEAGNARQGFFEAAEFDTVLEKLPEHLRDAARFTYACGWRRGEVVALRWDWVDRAAGTITLPDSKNSHGRVLAIAGDLVELMKRREAARLVETRAGDVKVSDYVFHRQGKPLGDFKKAWTTARIAAGLATYVKDPTKKSGRRLVAEKTFHDTRRTAARNLVRSGVREGVAMTVTGHKTRSVFDRYNITSTDDVRAALEAVKASRD